MTTGMAIRHWIADGMDATATVIHAIACPLETARAGAKWANGMLLRATTLEGIRLALESASGVLKTAREVVEKMNGRGYPNDESD